VTCNSQDGKKCCDWANALAASAVSDRTAGRSCQCWKKLDRQIAATCADSDNDDSEVASGLSDLDLRRQNWNDLLAGAQQRDLRLGWVEPQAAGTHPVVNVTNASSKALYDTGSVADSDAYADLAVVSRLVQVPITS